MSTLQPAIFLDRDGTINRDRGYVTKPQEFELEDGAVEAIRLINESDFLAIVATNQASIARGSLTEEGLNDIHQKMKTELAMGEAHLDGIYFCPHYSEKDFAEGKAVNAIPCECRKPKTGLIDRAAKEMFVDLSRSWFVGDTTIDMMAAKNANLTSVLVRTGEAGKDGKFDVKPDFEAENLLEAVRLILYEYDKPS
jgi:mannose-1-phosphate guanylyltransferase / phosphomannomutase